MPATVPAVTLVITRITATNSFQFLVQNPNGGIRTCFALLQADMATAAALAAGASATFTYGQDGVGPTGPTRNDYPNSFTMETF
jgi:hypothetical protein